MLLLFMVEIKKLMNDIKRIAADYQEKYKINLDDDWYIFKVQEELGELIQKYLMVTGRGRQKGMSRDEIWNDFEDEAADTLCILLLLIEHFGIDIEQAIERKWLVHLE